MNRKLIRKIAKQHKTTVKDVRESFGELVECAYENPNQFVTNICHNGEKPTVDEFVEGVTLEVKSRIKIRGLQRGQQQLYRLSCERLKINRPKSNDEFLLKSRKGKLALPVTPSSFAECRYIKKPDKQFTPIEASIVNINRRLEEMGLFLE